MTKKWDGKDRRSAQRRDAEKVVADIAPQKQNPDPGEVLMHELLVHKVELEMQNEELRKAHVEMEEARDRYMNLYEFAPISYITLDRDGLISKINLTGSILLGVHRYQLISRRFSQYVAPSDRDRWHRQFLRMMKHPEANKQEFELEMVRPDGTIYQVQLNCLNWDMDDKEGSLRIVLTDISKLKQIEAELSIAATVFESYEPMLVTNDHNVILRVNRAFTESTGYTAEEVVGQTPKMFCSGYHEEEIYADMWKRLNEDGHWIGELHNKHKDGETYIEHMHITAVKNLAGDTTHYTAIFSEQPHHRTWVKRLFRPVDPLPTA